jgi:osmotically-inducible protein OsmY
MNAKLIFALCILAGFITLAGCSTSSSGPKIVSYGSGAAPDAQTVKAIQDKINADPALKGASIQVSIENGALVLEGTVTSTQQSQQAQIDAASVQTQNKMTIGAYNKLKILGK